MKLSNKRNDFCRARGTWLGVVLCLAAGETFVPPCQADEVITLAGTGKQGYSLRNPSAKEAELGLPFGLALAPDGTLYVCEVANHVIRRINEKENRISTIVGSGGQKGVGGEGGEANLSGINEPYEVRFDKRGDMWFVERENNTVQRVDVNTRIATTVAGRGSQGDEGDGGPANRAELSMPHSIALDNDKNCYICDIGNHRVRVVNRNGGIDTFAGTGMRGPTPDGAPRVGTPLNGPRALDFDPEKNCLYLATREGNQIFRIDLKTDTLHLVAGTGMKGFTGDGGDAKLATFSGPKGVAVGPGGDLYVADTENHAIRVIRASTGVIETLVGDGQKGDGPDGDPRKCRLARPHGVCVDAKGNVYIGDSENHRVRKLVHTP